MELKNDDVVMIKANFKYKWDGNHSTDLGTIGIVETTKYQNSNTNCNIQVLCKLGNAMVHHVFGKAELYKIGEL